MHHKAFESEIGNKLLVRIINVKKLRFVLNEVINYLRYAEMIFPIYQIE